jgi:hypothetical protein
MRIAQPAGSKAAAVIAPIHLGGRQPLVHRSRRVRYNENRAKTARVAVVLSLFLVVLAAGLLIGGHAVINPLLQKAAERREAHRMGDIVFSMRGGLLCRHLSFNRTAAITEGAVEPCEPDLSKDNTAAAKGFAWGAR